MAGFPVLNPAGLTGKNPVSVQTDYLVSQNDMNCIIYQNGF